MTTLPRLQFWWIVAHVETTGRFYPVRYVRMGDSGMHRIIAEVAYLAGFDTKEEAIDFLKWDRAKYPEDAGTVTEELLEVKGYEIPRGFADHLSGENPLAPTDPAGVGDPISPPSGQFPSQLETENARLFDDVRKAPTGTLASCCGSDCSQEVEIEGWRGSGDPIPKADSGWTMINSGWIYCPDCAARQGMVAEQKRGICSVSP